MIIKELRLIVRKILFNKTYTLINIIGLSVGIICSIIAFLYVRNELKYDKHFTNTKFVYRLTTNNNRAASYHAHQPVIFYDKILKSIPEINSGCRLWNTAVVIKLNNNLYTENNFLHVDSNFFDFFGWPLISGNPEKALKEPFTVTISESKVKEIFPDENPIGKTIRINNEDDYTITGVFKNIPGQSHISANYLVSFVTLKIKNPGGYNSWGWHGTSLYFRIHPEANITEVNQKIADVWNRESKDGACVGDFVKVKMQPFSEIWLKSGYLYSTADNMSYVLGFAIIAAMILIIACFNFINLFLAINSRGAVDTGIKKVLGAGSKVFTRQVLLEIILYLSIAIIISIISINIILPILNSQIDKNLTFSIIHNSSLIIFIILLVLCILFISGFFPVIQLLYTNTVGVLKGVSVFSSKTISHEKIRSGLVVAQFTIGIILILGAIIVNKQLNLIRKHNLGFNKDQVLVIYNQTGDINKIYNLLNKALDSYPEIQNISCGKNIPSHGLSNWGAANVKEHQEQFAQFCAYVSVGDNYFKTIGAEIIEGRDFNPQLKDDREKVIINEALRKELNLTDPIGKKLSGLWYSNEPEIIGVVDDIEYYTIHTEDIPAMFFYENFSYGNYCDYIILKLKSDNLSKTVAAIKDEWKNIIPEVPINYTFLDTVFELNYRKESQTALLINILTGIAIILCCLGLFGLALFTINRRIKEIGVRKVNGAKNYEIMALVNREFVIWIFLAYIIAVPVSSLFIIKWLDNFALKTSFPWWSVLLTGIIALFIALSTVSWQSWQAARRNPVEALRYE